ncbi:MAG: pyrimidine-nucleoside phosphorylase [Clostridium sp.]
MRISDIILKKRNNQKLTKEEIEFFVDGYTDGSIPDYQASALLMAIYFNGMDSEETLNLTMAMASSGDMIDLSKIYGVKVDKHSTGGVGDKISICLAPMVAACGCKVAKMSGRGLSHTGGTIDKLESIEGMKLNMSEDEFIDSVNNISIAIAAQTGHIAPADKKIYALRDVTATVDNLSLIASSVMSKKLASGADGIVLDVKMGSGAFMKTLDDAKDLAQAMVDIGKGAGRQMVALITNMDEPLGYNIGNSLEVIEAIDVLKGTGPSDVYDLTLEIGGYMLMMASLSDNLEEAKSKLQSAIDSGKALDKLCEMVSNQGGNKDYIHDTSLFKTSSKSLSIISRETGYISHIDSQLIGEAALCLGAGREHKHSIIDLSAGITLKKKVGDYVEIGDEVGILYYNNDSQLEDSINRFYRAYSYSINKVNKRDLIQEIVK